MKYLSIFLILILAVSVQAASELPKPEPNTRVYDFGGILQNSLELNQELLAYEKQTTVEIAIVTVENIPTDYTIESYALGILETWGVGKKSEDNGIVVLINKESSPGSRLRIETGYGIEGYIPDAKAGRILDRALPSYTSGNYSEAARIILDGLKDALKDYQPGKQPEPDYTEALIEFLANFGIFLFFILIFVVVGFFGRPKCPQCKSKKLKSDGDFYVCKKCGKRFKKPKDRRDGAFVYVGGGSGGFGGGGGGFGGGGGGGGGASRIL